MITFLILIVLLIALLVVFVAWLAEQWRPK